MKKSLLLLVFAIALAGSIIFSCSHEDVFEPDVKVEEGSIMEVNINPSDLGARMVFLRTPAEMTNLIEAPMQTQSYEKTPPQSYYWELLAEMPVLEHDGHDLSATQVDIHGDYAYITYNVQGNEFAGALEIIDISDVEEPEVVSITTFDDIDINSIAIDKIGLSQPMTIWLAGSSNLNGAVVIRLNSINGVVVEDSETMVSLEGVFEEGVSASANSICKVKNYIYVTSGNSYGGITMLNIADLSYVKHHSFPAAKYVISNNENQEAGNKILVLSTGDNAKLRVYDLDLTEEDMDMYDLGVIKHDVENPAFTYYGKNTMAVDGNKKLVYIAMGDRGVIAMNHDTGEIEYPSPEGLLENGNTNAVTMDNFYLYFANGADGLTIAPIPGPQDDEIVPIFMWDMEEEPASANYAFAHKVGNNYYIFVAKGLGGLNILVREDVED